MDTRSDSLPVGWLGTRTAADRTNLIETALGKRPADLVIKGAEVYNPFLGVFQKGDLAISDGRVAGLGSYEGHTKIDGSGGYLIAGFIDSHVHIESSMTGPLEFAKTLSEGGTTTVVADPHEIANVAGLTGLSWLLKATEDLPITVFVMTPSCVPASPLERGGAVMGRYEIARFLSFERVLGLGEMMNFPGVINSDPEVLAKLSLAVLIDGHSPGLKDESLRAYAGAGISTDHECRTKQEALERISYGQRVLMRQGTAAKNLLDLLPAVNNHNFHFFHLSTDDRHARDLVREGSINHLVALAAAARPKALGPIINMATLNPSIHYDLRELGALVPGRVADMALYPDLKDFKPSIVWRHGIKVAENGRSLWNKPPPPTETFRDTVILGPLDPQSLKVKATGPKVRVIGVVPDQIVTKHLIENLPTHNGFYEADGNTDLAKMAVWDRYGSKSPPAVGFIRGLGIRQGAIGTTVSHDSHNLSVAGVNDADMLVCAAHLEKIGGGLALALNGQIIDALPLPLGGLMSELTMSQTAATLDRLVATCPKMGFAAGFDPFMLLSFMSLSVIPSLKLTAGGLVDAVTFESVATVF
ncbi:MAG: adenine deaminase [Deltaproteobacteria bacterium]|jgi:adenine deaminase|nr:adenine deaminase [Deltaproteobacteria bacterium]